MSMRKQLYSKKDVLTQFAAITGIGWTASLLGYLGAVLGYGTAIVPRVAPHPQSLLYVGGILLVTTFGLDRLEQSLSNAENDA